jgi:hypothetical protein
VAKAAVNRRTPDALRGRMMAKTRDSVWSARALAPLFEVHFPSPISKILGFLEFCRFQFAIIRVKTPQQKSMKFTSKILRLFKDTPRGEGVFFSHTI